MTVRANGYSSFNHSMFEINDGDWFSGPGVGDLYDVGGSSGTQSARWGIRYESHPNLTLAPTTGAFLRGSEGRASAILGGNANMVASNSPMENKPFTGLSTTTSHSSTILGGIHNRVMDSPYSSIIGGRDNIITTDTPIVNATGFAGNIILGGYINGIEGSTASNGGNVIVGGNYNDILDTENTIILGGNNIVATKSNTVYLPDVVITKNDAIPTSTADVVGVTGSVTWDDNNIYVKTSVGWKSASLSTF
jgi:hypothetical protein